MNYFDKTYLCFITSDGDKEAKDIFDERIKKNLWPIYHRTMKFRKVKEQSDMRKSREGGAGEEEGRRGRGGARVDSRRKVSLGVRVG